MGYIMSIIAAAVIGAAKLSLFTVLTVAIAVLGAFALVAILPIACDSLDKAIGIVKKATKAVLRFIVATLAVVFFAPFFIVAYVLTHLLKLGSEEDRENMPTPLEFIGTAYGIY